MTNPSRRPMQGQSVLRVAHAGEDGVARYASLLDLARAIARLVWQASRKPSPCVLLRIASTAAFGRRIGCSFGLVGIDHGRPMRRTGCRRSAVVCRLRTVGDLAAVSSRRTRRSRSPRRPGAHRAVEPHPDGLRARSNTTAAETLPPAKYGAPECSAAFRAWASRGRVRVRSGQPHRWWP
jgi:hypothetical protein